MRRHVKGAGLLVSLLSIWSPISWVLKRNVAPDAPCSDELHREEERVPVLQPRLARGGCCSLTCSLALSTLIKLACSRPCFAVIPGLQREPSLNIQHRRNVPANGFVYQCLDHCVGLKCAEDMNKMWDTLHRSILVTISIMIMQGSSSLSLSWSSPGLCPSWVSSWWSASVIISSASIPFSYDNICHGVFTTSPPTFLDKDLVSTDSLLFPVFGDASAPALTDGVTRCGAG